jgi:uncharacterized protein YndB with AHSA1/START domain
MRIDPLSGWRLRLAAMNRLALARCSAVWFAVLAACASANTGNVTPHGFISIFRDEVAVQPDELWRAVTQLPRWWSSSHTYSGEAANLSLDVQAGGCWCERWGDGQSVEHGRVVLVMPQRTLRIYGNLGPLQELPVHGVLTFTIAMQESKTILRMTYRVSGPPDAGLDKLAPVVDRVMGEQFKRLKSLAETGRPE